MIPFGLASLMTVSMPIARRATKCLVPGASAIYLFDEGTGTTLLDHSGNGNHGTFGAGAAAPTWTQYGLSFDGGDNSRCGTAPDGSATGITVVVVGARTAGTFASKQTGTNASGKLGWGIHFNGTSTAHIGQVYNGTGTRIDCTSTDPAGSTLSCVTLVADGSTAVLYSGTTPGTPATCVGISLAPEQQLTIGDLSYNLGGLPLIGTVAALVVYPFALAPNQIAQNAAYFRALAASRGLVPSW